ncbi:efflux RND transporter periplasmic adaptor subunit [Phenylobacterium sp.]|uniref:efflux RND transporter periplasmic adaptor subunit n=1 Tax=Phenylobacterium sp. TaxID=1871053 RepID=UPI0025D25F31|nr:efflux RND transporter periplasmic adaptor subunit [Phenylobacterium sp.]
MSRRSAAASGLLALVLAACAGQKPSGPPPAPPAVEVTPVTFRALRQWDDFTGRLEAVQNVEVRPRVAGYIDKVRFQDGAPVRRGEILVEIDPRPYQDEVDRLDAAVKRGEAQATLARSDADRAERLMRQNAIAQGELERFSATASSAGADVEAAKAALKAARLNLEFTKVVSPIDGRVSKAVITRGNLVTPASLLTTVVSEAPIYAAFNADEQAFLKYAGGQRGKGGAVLVGLATETGFPHRGHLAFLDNAVDAGSGTISARALLDNADRALTPGLFARVRLVSSAVQTVALVPEGALGTDLGKRYVLVVDATRHVQMRPVVLGPSTGLLRIVTTGLRPGDQIVTAGLQKVKPGDAVTPHTSAPTIGPAELADLETVQ